MSEEQLLMMEQLAGDVRELTYTKRDSVAVTEENNRLLAENNRLLRKLCIGAEI